MKKKPKLETTSSGNKYDRIFRENIESIFLPIIERHLNIKIKNKEPLPEKLVSTVEREVDTLYRIETVAGDKFLLHWETQTRNDKNMLYRVGEYHALDLKKYKLPIIHVVLYLGETPSNMRSILPENEIYTGFELLSIRDMNAEELLASKIPEEVLLSILADYDKKESNNMIRSILLKLEELCKDEKSVRKYTNQLTILSKLRNLETETISKIKDMPQLFDIRTSVLFKEGREEGREEGLKVQLLTVVNMLTKTEMLVEQIADLSETDVAFVYYVKEKIVLGEWQHPYTWTDDEWRMYFKKK